MISRRPVMRRLTIVEWIQANETDCGQSEGVKRQIPHVKHPLTITSDLRHRVEIQYDFLNVRQKSGAVSVILDSSVDGWVSQARGPSAPTHNND
jgi:hypothetical protein